MKFDTYVSYWSNKAYVVVMYLQNLSKMVRGIPPA